MAFLIMVSLLEIFKMADTPQGILELIQSKL